MDNPAYVVEIYIALKVTFLSGLGTFIVILGVLLYNVALGIDARYILAI